MATQVSLLSGAVASAGSLKLQTNGTTDAVTIDTSQNLGLGVTPSAWNTYTALQVQGMSLSAYTNGDTRLSSNAYYASGWKYIASRPAVQYLQDSANGIHAWNIAASGTAGNAITFTQAMTLDASGNLGLGVTSPIGLSNYHGLTLSGSTGGFIRFQNDAGTQNAQIAANNSSLQIECVNTGIPIQFYTGGSERARIDSSGVLLVNKTGYTSGVTSLCKFQVLGTGGDYAATVENSSTSTPYGLLVKYSGTNPANTSYPFIYAIDSVSARFYVTSNGGIYNYSANNVNLSDRREKTNFAPAGDYLAKICTIPVQTYNYIDQNLEEDAGLTLGVVAQDVEAVAPELVTESDWSAEKDGSKMRLSIYQTDLQYALMKSIQELKAIVDAQAAEIAALKG